MSASELVRHAMLVSCALVALAGVAVEWGIVALQERLITPRDGVMAEVDADAAVALGYALERNGSLTQLLRTRVEVATQLFEQGAARLLLFSGGHPGGGLRVRSEAAAMAAYASSLLPAESRQRSGEWLLEEQSMSTRENALFSLQMLQPLKPARVAVVTNPFHQLRSLLTFRCAAKQLGLAELDVVVAYVPPQSPPQRAAVGGERAMARQPAHVMQQLWLQVGLLREVAALGWYWLRGWLC